VVEAVLDDCAVGPRASACGSSSRLLMPVAMSTPRYSESRAAEQLLATTQMTGVGFYTGLRADVNTPPAPAGSATRSARDTGSPMTSTPTSTVWTWLATYVFLAKDGAELDPDDDAAYAFVISVAAGEIDDVGEIATVLASWQAA